MHDETLPPVALIGTGAMGSRMAMRLIAAGFPLTVWNRTPSKTEQLVAKGARLASSPGDAAVDASFVLVMVEGDEASHAVWSGSQGLGAVLAPETIAIECSTLSLTRVETLAGEVARRGGRFLEAPVSGSLPQAAEGRLVFFVGGTEQDANQAGLLLRHMGWAAHHLGAPPMATRAKLAVNGMLASQVASVAETFGFLTEAGLGAAEITELLTETPVASPIVKATCQQIETGDFTPLFPISLMNKDLTYLAAAARLSGAVVPQAASASHLFCKAMTWQAQNISAVAKIFTTPTPDRSTDI